MRYVLWLDDDKVYRDPDRACPNYWMMYTWREAYFPDDTKDLPLTWVHTYEEFITTVQENGLPVAISFDNDLGFEKEGKHCAKWLFEYCIDNNLEMPAFDVHSANPIAQGEIYSILRDDWEKYKKLNKEIS